MRHVTEKTGHDNRQTNGINGTKRTWTPIKPMTVQSAAGRTQTAEVVIKQFPLRPAAAKNHTQITR